METQRKATEAAAKAEAERLETERRLAAERLEAVRSSAASIAKAESERLSVATASLEAQKLAANDQAERKAEGDRTDALRMEGKTAAQDCNDSSKDNRMAACDIAIQQNPKDAVSFSNRGIGWSLKGDQDRALSDYNEAIRLNPQFANAFANRGNAWRAKGDKDRAIADYNEAIRLNPQLANAFYMRGSTWQAKGDKDRAIADYNEAIRLNPQFANAFYVRGNAWSAKGDKDTAISDYSEAIRLNPQFANAFWGRGRAWEDKRDLVKALSDFQSWSKLDQSNPQAPKAISRILEAMETERQAEAEHSKSKNGVGREQKNQKKIIRDQVQSSPLNPAETQTKVSQSSSTEPSNRKETPGKSRCNTSPLSDRIFVGRGFMDMKECE